MASEKAKELARQQKEQVRAEKLRKKNSTDPKDWGQLRQLRELYKVTAQENPRFGLMLAGAFLLPVIIAVIVGLLLHMLAWVLPLGVMVGMLLALLLFNREIKKATFSRVEGQAGSADVALQMLGKGWNNTPGVNFSRDMDIIHRTIGPAGIILVGEGNPGRVKGLLANEAKRHSNLAYDAKVTTIVMGDQPGQVPLKKLTDHIKKLPKVYDAVQVDDVTRRAKALDAVRPKIAMPKGPINTRGARQSMRGR